MNNGNFESTGLEVAVIGISGCFPGAKSTNELWENLIQGKETVSFFSDKELREAGVEASTLADPNYVKANGLLDEPYQFDNQFFEYQDREAELMDPQLRLLHECTWNAFENAGYATTETQNRVGVFVGATDNLLWLSTVLNMVNNDPVALFEADTIIKKDYFATRLAYKLNLKGPAVNIQTACSTSLVAVHMAVQNLLNGDCDMAVAGGASVQAKKEGYRYQEGMIMSPDGHCRPFDANAKGIVGGEGVGAVILKRLEDAEQDGDQILAVIKGSAINNDGNEKVGFTAPSVQGQKDVITSALEMAEVDPSTITYVECHGTGTQLGDPIEIEALTQAFSETEKQFCRIGSLKSNIGHLDAAAGIAGFIKTVMCLQLEKLPASLHYKSANPNINFVDSPFIVNSELHEWKSEQGPLRAGVSSFGIGGTNAHVVLEQYRDQRVSGESREWQVFLLSAKTKNALTTRKQDLNEYVNQHESQLPDISYTLQVGRTDLSHRQAVIVGPNQKIQEILKGEYPGQVLEGHVNEGETQSTVFMFPGQGSQYGGMLRELYDSEPEFKSHVDACFDILDGLLTQPIKSALLAENDDQQASELLKNTACTQPALFVSEYALAKLLMGWGIEPTSMIGHSIGEYVAACLAGVFSLEDALRLVVQRGQLMANTQSGRMLSISLPADKLEHYLSDNVSVAASNSSDLSVVSGPELEIDTMLTELTKNGVKCSLLHTSHAYHSDMMKPILPEFMMVLKSIKFFAPEKPYISNVTGSWITAEQATSHDYWCQHLVSTVAFSEGLDKLLSEPNNIFVEIGPGHTLSSFIRRHKNKQGSHRVLNTMRHAREEHSADQQLLHALGGAFTAGVAIDWERYRDGEQRMRVGLPGYSFEAKSFIPGKMRANNLTVNDEHGDTALHSRPNVSTAYVAPEGETQENLAQIWKNLFKIESVGIHDNFFELGGHSLLSVRLISYIEKEMMCKFSPEQIFNMNTIFSQSEFINQLQEIEKLRTSMDQESDEVEELQI
ncbi:hypothetical protein CJF42_03470 [Pseudoalteromonas sp. NBT06-2]|uniref:type I polyketide synthase n=1 Tax=Pseudoalteromonas sp. NBT06-2 TaxID=2025950 RepID=UPI000BA6A4DE|nr:type I polyketide synthase [Pseudoalteromonas sp. NBT06-2]PAJ75703.1 hypothetical protein CJF42_03470 [Pseudoalteromonas sp. NBT06-2]